MAFMEVTENGVTALEDVLTSVVTMFSADYQQQVTVWDNGSLVVEEVNGDSEPTTYVCLDAVTVKQLAAMLQRPEVQSLLSLLSL